MAQYLHRINSKDEAPSPNVIFIYNLSGGTCYINQQDYDPGFARYWCMQTPITRKCVKNALTLDLSSAAAHCVVLDLDFKKLGEIREPPYNAYIPVLESTLKMLFLSKVTNYTFIVAVRAGGYGIHIHLPEFIIAHDDYIKLCQQLKPLLAYSIPGVGRYELDIPIHFMLPGAAKPNQEPYEPLEMVYVDEKQTCRFNFEACAITQFETFKKKFKRVKMNKDSFFRLFCSTSDPHLVNYFMLPIPASALLQVFSHRLCFATRIGNTLSESSDFDQVATFTYTSSSDIGYIEKGKQLLFDGSHFQKCLHYLRINGDIISDFETNNVALKYWFKLYSNPINAKSCTNPIFSKITMALRENNCKFTRDPSPIKTIMEYNMGCYFLPMFYALCKVLDLKTSEMVCHLKGMVSHDYFPLLDRLEQVDEQHIKMTMADITEETIFFCGNNLCPRYQRNRDKLRQMVLDCKRAILSVTTSQQMTELFRSIQESHFPIKVLRQCNALRKPSAYIWNCITQSWKEITAEREKESHLVNLWSNIVAWVTEYRNSGNFGGPDEEFLRKFDLSTVMSTITSDSHLEQKTIQMDRHKWFIRLQDGLLDILTGHIGETVPELFLSDKRLGINVSRERMIELYHKSPELEELYSLLMDKLFFLRYLKSLFRNRTDDLFDTLQEMVHEEMLQVARNNEAISMMHFYIHLCKYTAFEHDLMMYLSDVLASIFIATNYERKFFVCKGETSNGKSKLFEILGRVFGGYYHCIQSDNLKPGNSSSTATPDLASTMFNCRIVTSEELEGKMNENRVKQMTGNSCVTFRNLYEGSTGGIPTAKLFASTNNVPDCRSTEAFQDRVTAIPFLSRFVNKPPVTTSEQVRCNRYGKDECAVERSFMGCFLMLLYHLKKHMNIKDGLLHYRDEPPSVVEYTQIYLYNTDVYNQFKTHMDIQLSENQMTTMGELRSAVRQFLKGTKNNTTAEADLIVKFEDEFGEYRRSDDLQYGTTKYTSMLDPGDEPPESTTLSELQDELPAKKRKPSTEDSGSYKKPKMESAVVYYQNVVIRNLTRRDN